MSDFFEIDFLAVGSSKSGDAIPLRYELSGETFIHVVDGGYQNTGPDVAKHVKRYYGNATHIDHVVVSHPDGDHAGGLRTILEQFAVGRLWMLRPWLYAGELLPRFARFTSTENLTERLKEIYPNLAALEELALERNVDIYDPFQGAEIGAFSVLAPSKQRYLDLIVESDKSPQSIREAQEKARLTIGQVVGKAVNFIRSLWGHEVFSSEETSAENEMGVVQCATLCGESILLTADAGRAALAEAADYAPNVGLVLPGISRFQVPHHGSRRNVSTELLDRWLGPRMKSQLPTGQEPFSAIVSAAKDDDDHPRKAVVRALVHRGAKVMTTKKAGVQTYRNAPDRGWSPAPGLDYPEDQEE